MRKALMAAIVTMAASSVHSQVEIVDSKPMRAESAANRGNTAQSSAAANQAELHYQLQLLQQEVLELRGLVEQQAYELRQLKQQRLDDYVDLDRRIGELSASGATTAVQPAIPASGTRVTTTTSPAAASNTADPGEELTSYRTAIDLVLKQRDFDGGIAALEAYLSEYPSGHYAGNAQYWLGQIYLQKDELTNSQQWFSKMIQEYPNHQKVEEAKFKLAKVYDQQGDKQAAEKLLREVADSSTPAASLAQDYLNQYF